MIALPVGEGHRIEIKNMLKEIAVHLPQGSKEHAENILYFLIGNNLYWMRDLFEEKLREHRLDDLDLSAVSWQTYPMRSPHNHAPIGHKKCLTSLQQLQALL
jgi:hypothetical protein